MKKILCIVALGAFLSLSVFADGGMESGGKTCTSHCLVNPASQTETTKEIETNKSITETINDLFGKISGYFTEISF
jgi:hypothetical protein